MTATFAIFPTPFAKWSRNTAIFAVQLLVAGVLLHRVLSLPTPVALNIFAATLVLAGIAIGLGGVATVVIWRHGRSGTWSTVTGILVGLAILAWPLVYLPFALQYPSLNDVTTDTISPPRFIGLAKKRPKDANPSAYAGPAIAKLQLDHYPDIRPMLVPRKIDETFEIVSDTMRRMRWTIVGSEQPQGKGRPGYIEATDRTLVIGFYDDIVVRLDGDQRETRIDVKFVDIRRNTSGEGSSLALYCR